MKFEDIRDHVIETREYLLADGRLSRQRTYLIQSIERNIWSSLVHMGAVDSDYEEHNNLRYRNIYILVGDLARVIFNKKEDEYKAELA